MKILRAPEIFAGEGNLKQVVSIAKRMKLRHILVVSGRNVVRAGIYAELANLLQAAGVECIHCDKVEPEPSIDVARQIVAFARDSAAEAVIGLGGGSALDAAKVAAALMTNPQPLETYLGIELIKNDPVPLIAIPTTAGTGSEVTPVAVLSNTEQQFKQPVYSARIIPSYAILDPLLTLDLPREVSASSGMDALTHAIEAYTAVHANLYTDILALKAIDLLIGNIRTACSGQADVKVRENMLIGSLFAGIAFANAGVAAVHAFANSLSAMFHVPHGVANSLMLSTVLAYNASGASGKEEKFREIARRLTRDDRAAIDGGIAEIDRLCQELAIPPDLKAAGIPAESIPQMAERVMKSPNLLTNNPRIIAYEDAVALYEKAFTRP